MGEGRVGHLTDPHPLALQAGLNASCVSPCHKASHEKKGQLVSERSLQKEHRLKQEKFGLDAGKDFLNVNEQLVEGRPLPTAKRLESG